MPIHARIVAVQVNGWNGDNSLYGTRGVYEKALQSKGGLRMFKRPDKDKLYVACVDVARGTGKDYSAFIILDVTKNKDGKISGEDFKMMKKASVGVAVLASKKGRETAKKVMKAKSTFVENSILYFFVLGSIFPTARVLLIGSESAVSLSQLIVSILPELFTS